MAMFHYKERFFTKTKTGGTAWAKASYRANERLYDEANHRHVYLGDNKDIVAYSNIYLPDGCPERLRERQILWNEVMIAEKNKNAQWGHEFELSFSNELTFDQCKSITERFIEEHLSSKGMICDASIHWKDGNHHVHIMTPTRPFDLEKDAFGAKSKKVDGKKINLVADWYDKETLKERRKAWADLQNEYLSQEHQVSEKSYKDQGIEKTPRRFLSRGDYEALKDITDGKDIPDRNLSHPETLISILEDRRKTLDTELIKDVMTIERKNHMVQEQNKSIEKTEYPFGCDLDKVKLKYVCVTNEQIDSGEDAMVRFESEYNLYSKICKANGNEHLRLSKDRYAKEKYGVDIHLFVEKTIGRNTDGEWLKYWINDGVTGYEKNARVLNYDELRDAMNDYNEKHGIQIENRIVENPLYHIEDDPTNLMLDKDSKSNIKYAKYQISKNFKEIQKHPDLMNKLKDCTIKYKQGISKAIEAVNAKLIDSIGSGGGAGGSGRDGESAEEFERFMAPIVKAFMQLAMEIIEKLKEYKKQMVYVTDFKADPTPVKPELAKKSVEHTKSEMTPYEQLVKGSDKEVTKMSLEERVEWAKLQSALSSIKDEKVIKDFNSRVTGHIKLDGSQMQDLIKLANDLKKLSVKDIKALDKVKVDDLVR